MKAVFFDILRFILISFLSITCCLAFLLISSWVYNYNPSSPADWNVLLGYMPLWIIQSSYPCLGFSLAVFFISTQRRTKAPSLIAAGIIGYALFTGVFILGSMPEAAPAEIQPNAFLENSFQHEPGNLYYMTPEKGPSTAIQIRGAHEIPRFAIHRNAAYSPESSSLVTEDLEIPLDEEKLLLRPHFRIPRALARIGEEATMLAEIFSTALKTDKVRFLVHSLSLTMVFAGLILFSELARWPLINFMITLPLGRLALSGYYYLHKTVVPLIRESSGSPWLKFMPDIVSGAAAVILLSSFLILVYIRKLKQEY